MSNLIQVQKTDVYSNTEAEIRVSLADMEQPIITIQKTTTYNSTTGNYNTEPRKFLVKELIYAFDKYSYQKKSETLNLVRLNGSFFLKGDRKIGGRENTIYLKNIDKAERKLIIDQIPTQLHEYAEVELRDVLQPTLDYMIRVGVVTNYA